MNAKTDYTQQALPCPFCGSTNLTPNLWELEHGEVDAIECNQCKAGAPLTAWNVRHNQIEERWQKQLQNDSTEQTEDLLHL